ncbi:hypothetical protein L208DRAFT_1266720 [Tricholoma matsutake]|nr:hypothetical protein L208DRAFT_1266720 [Tricholoma matsutake 945]
MLSECTCGVAVSQDEISAGCDVICCKKTGCETQWYHLQCIGLEYATSGWTCEACGSDHRGKHCRA